MALELGKDVPLAQGVQHVEQTRYGTRLVNHARPGDRLLAMSFGATPRLYLISPASRGKVRLISGMQMISNSPANSASM
jgi:hypothetical protein